MDPKGTPFRRAFAMMAALASINNLPFHLRQAALGDLGPYRSRGKGRGKFSGRFDAHRMARHSGQRDMPNGQQWPQSGCGKRETARRRRQMHGEFFAEVFEDRAAA